MRQRGGLQRRLTSVKNRLRRILGDSNADRPSLFTVAGLAYLAQVPAANLGQPLLRKAERGGFVRAVFRNRRAGLDLRPNP